MGFFGWLGWIAFAIALYMLLNANNHYSSYFEAGQRVDEHFHSGSQTAENKIAIITVDGLITHQDGFAKWQIDRAMADDNVKAVVLRVDSPGGTVTGSNYLYHQLQEMQKKKNIKLVVSMGAICASGGYYISMAAGQTPDVIFAEPTTWTGSIGVLIPHYDLTGLLAKFNVTDDSIASNPLKLTGSPTYKAPADIAEKQRQILQTLVDESFKDFKEIVKSGRATYKADPAKLDTVATGQVYTAKQAVDNGLVDKIGYLDEAVTQAAKINGLDPANVRVVKYAKPKGLLDDLVGGSLSESRAASGLSAQGLTLDGLLELATPRAYYIWSGLPTLAK